MNYFAKRKPNDFNNKIKKVFNFLSLTGKYKIIGSASLKSILYANDYDLNEDYSKKAVTVYDKVYHIFREKFVTAKRNPNIFIIDFKCGEQDGSPIRWDYKSMMKGTQVLSNAETISFQDCLKMKSTIKLDIIALVNSVFLDITENYFLKLNSTSTFETSSKTAILKSIKTSYDECIAEKEYFKALKRSFSFKSMKSPKKFKSLGCRCRQIYDAHIFRKIKLAISFFTCSRPDGQFDHSVCWHILGQRLVPLCRCRGHHHLPLGVFHAVADGFLATLAPRLDLGRCAHPGVVWRHIGPYELAVLQRYQNSALWFGHRH
jgi:hypothetical protein